jgi:hypothetical protein
VEPFFFFTVDKMSDAATVDDVDDDIRRHLHPAAVRKKASLS